jgi:ribosomal protein S18 acetylase RimI-like enzyme
MQLLSHHLEESGAPESQPWTLASQTVKPTLDARLLRRLELAEMRMTYRFAAACAEGRNIDLQTKWTAGGYALFAGHWTHLTRLVGFGVLANPVMEQIRSMERFFFSRHSPVVVSVPDTLEAPARLLRRRGYRYLGAEDVMVRLLCHSERQIPRHRIQPARGSQRDWARAVACGFLGRQAATREEEEIGLILARINEARRFEARSATGQIAGAGSLMETLRVALFVGDCTNPRFRGQGIQNSLILHRISECRGSTYAVATTAPGEASNRNYRRCGFHRLYSRLTFIKENSG